MKKRISVLIVLSTIIAFAFTTDSINGVFIKKIGTQAAIRYKKILDSVAGNENLFPRTVANNRLVSTDKYDWTSGFFAGNLWYVYEVTQSPEVKAAALAFTEKSEATQYYTGNHDLGFMMYCSYGNAYKQTKNEKYKAILIQSAKSLCQRYNEKIGLIKSWNSFKSWHGNKSYSFPVIIDNMMNLELLFFASKATGDPYYKNVAISHAKKTIQNQLRADNSCYHVVCYDSTTGNVEAKETAQGYADNSVWSRGQAWGIYGFTLTYRETKDPQFLKTAMKMADYYINSSSLPKDKIPYWDFNIFQPGYQPSIHSYANNVTEKYRDASAAAITASALLELSQYSGKEGKKYKKIAIAIIKSLASPKYFANENENGNFLIKHCVGSIPHKSEIDVPLVYADYYFLEALARYNNMLNGQPLFE